jgi:hypothetical protein
MVGASSLLSSAAVGRSSDDAARWASSARTGVVKIANAGKIEQQKNATV